jgi:hypothetical protein
MLSGSSLGRSRSILTAISVISQHRFPALILRGKPLPLLLFVPVLKIHIVGFTDYRLFFK